MDLPLLSFVSHFFSDSSRCQFVVAHDGFPMADYHVVPIFSTVTGLLAETLLITVLHYCNAV